MNCFEKSLLPSNNAPSFLGHRSCSTSARGPIAVRGWVVDGAGPHPHAQALQGRPPTEVAVGVREGAGARVGVRLTIFDT